MEKEADLSIIVDDLSKWKHLLEKNYESFLFEKVFLSLPLSQCYFYVLFPILYIKQIHIIMCAIKWNNFLFEDSDKMFKTMPSQNS